MKRKKTKPLRAAAIVLMRSGAGVHSDQKRRKDANRLRRDKSYKEDRS